MLGPLRHTFEVMCTQGKEHKQTSGAETDRSKEVAATWSSHSL